ncbi:MAG: hypothetical protein COX48_00010 [bacterium (Candidatus Stahlbacteria) CG23_combo_of_CG06-09_8_20_14_all_34_7]|nr:MAG: hypothetical protein COX48_00010 [bacterium (Candidatus Stahlbacteria) CG23_combo_of_CG06-09_8_20_14_all_34_7]
MILLIFLLFPALLFSNELYYYIVSRDDVPTAYSEIYYAKNKIIERVLWFDGYSKEYSETKIDFENKIEYSSEIYYEDNKLPIKYTLTDGIFEKRLNDKIIKMHIDKDIKFVHKNSNLMLFLYFINENKEECVIFNCDKMNYFKPYAENLNLKIKGNEYKIFKGKNSVIDSAYIYNFQIRKSKTSLTIQNPYRINISKVFTERDFNKKKHHIAFSNKEFSGEISYDYKSDTIIVILPFSFSSDYNGNISSMKSFSSKQISENLMYPVLSLQLNLKSKMRHKLAKMIILLEEELKNSYSNIVFIAFNDLCIDLAKSKVKSRKIYINPPVLSIKEWSKVMFEKYSAKHKYMFSNISNFILYESLDTSITEEDIIETYSKSQNTYYLFSKTVMNNSEIKNAGKIKGDVFYIKNIDRRLNSYNIYDLWSFESDIQINKKIFNLINGIIKK